MQTGMGQSIALSSKERMLHVVKTLLLKYNLRFSYVNGMKSPFQKEFLGT